MNEYSYLREGNRFKSQALYAIVEAIRVHAAGEIQKARLDTERVTSKI